MKSRFNEMMAKTNPPEPACPKCGEICDEEDGLHCPDCGENLKNNYITEERFFCVNHGKSETRFFNIDDLKWRCPKCGFDGKPDKCVVCGNPIPPNSEHFGSSQCEKCSQLSEEEAYEDFLEEMAMSLNEP